MSEPIPSVVRGPKDPLLRKMLFVAFLVVALLLPLELIRGLVVERELRHAAVRQELANTWGGKQMLSGPVVIVPYLERSKNKEGELQTRTCLAYFLPETLRIEGVIEPEIRSRGIFDVVLYRVSLGISGNFSRPDFSSWRITAEDVLWDEASLSIGIPDLRGVEAKPKIAWDQGQLELQPGAGEIDLYSSGMHAALPGLAAAEMHGFSFALTLTGSEELLLTPSAKETEVSLSSKWQDPSFTGSFLPTERTVDASGFQANWKVSYFARPYSQRWRRTDGVVATLQQQMTASAFGVRLLDPVDFYRMSDRSVKYAMMFVLLTFLVFALFEILRRLRVHPVQYLLVGLAMCLFYLILLSASEQVGFGVAYTISTAATIGLVGGYASKVLGSFQHGGLVGAALCGLYGYLYVLLQLEDYALLLGTVGLFSILASVMYLTRNLDWYAVDLTPVRPQS